MRQSRAKKALHFSLHELKDRGLQRIHRKKFLNELKNSLQILLKSSPTLKEMRNSKTPNSVLKRTSLHPDFGFLFRASPSYIHASFSKIGQHGA